MSATRRFFRPTWAEVHLGALQENLRRFRRRMPARTQILFVVKGNAYGHGAVECARAAQTCGGAEWLGVSSVEEGVALREAGIRMPVLVLGSLYPFESFLAAVEFGLMPTVASLDSARRLVEVAMRRGQRVGCHLKIETGMGRIGMSPAAVAGVSGYLAAQRLVDVDGAYTHFSCADGDRAFTLEQLRRFRGALGEIDRAGFSVRLRHAANSAAALTLPAARLDLVRPGLAIYGLWRGFRPVLSLKSKVVFLKTVRRGAAIGYGATYRARRATRVATVPVGYADGLCRRLSNRGRALLGGRRCPIIGTVSMDMLMLDATDVPQARVGDDVVLIGRQGREEISAGELAQAAGSIAYEVVAALTARVPRVYFS
ncbi:MAG TPA: alanine racemase [Elusimicrobia bacterium]|nr:alanine racemase [Elusimicrobiota bacterium]HBT60632.1 alanine racemase [Elusimicrobiota bacterium]